MPWYLTFQPDGEDECTLPGGDTEEEALATKDRLETDFPTATVGAPFEESPDYGDTLPTPQSRIARSDGTEYTLYTDGSIKEHA
jgi:hypothetical protein